MGGYPISGLGRGVPHPRSRWGGTLSQVGGGTPSQVWGGTPSQFGGYLISGLGGYPISGGGPHPSSGGTQVWMMGGYLGYPHELGWMGYPPDQVWIRQSSIASTCYAAGGVPLAFTQEDFLVQICW